MQKLIILALIFINLSFAKVIQPNQILDIELKKDEVFNSNITYSLSNKGKSSTFFTKIFSMRWTLYKNEGLVVLLKYDKFPHQHLLYKGYAKDSFTLNLDSSNIKSTQNAPYISVYFDDIKDPFDDKKTKVRFKIYIYNAISE